MAAPADPVSWGGRAGGAARRAAATQCRVLVAVPSMGSSINSGGVACRDAASLLSSFRSVQIPCRLPPDPHGLPPNVRFPTASPYHLSGRSFVLMQEVREKS